MDAYQADAEVELSDYETPLAWKSTDKRLILPQKLPLHLVQDACH